MGWKIGDKITVDPQDVDLVPLQQGDNTRNSTLARIKKFLLGDETLKTTAQTIKGAINENTEQLSDIAISIKSFGAKGNANYRKYVESYWQDSAYTTQLYKKSDGTFWTDAGFTNQYTGTVYPKPENVTYWQDSNYTIPATDDSQAFKDAFDYITNNGKTGTLYIPDGNFLCNNYSIVINANKIKMIGNNSSKIISVGLSNNSKFITLTASGAWYKVYDQIRNAIQNLCIEGSYFQQDDVTNNGVIGVYYDTSVLTAHICLENVNVQWFNIGMYQAAGAYKQSFNKCSFVANDIGVFFDSAQGTGAVPIIFSNCFFECNTLAIKNHNLGTGQVHFVGGGIEYNNRVCDSWDLTTFTNIHFEMDIRVAKYAPFRVYGDTKLAQISIRDSWILTLGNELLNVLHWIPTPIFQNVNPDNLFECVLDTFTGNNLLNLDNVFISLNQSVATNVLIGGTGYQYISYKLKFDSVTSQNYLVTADSIYFNYRFDNSNYPTQALKDVYITADATRNTNRLNGTNIAVSTSTGINGQSLLITKKANSGAPATAGIFIPITKAGGHIIKVSTKLDKVLTTGALQMNVYYASAVPDVDTFNMDIFETDTIIGKPLPNNTSINTSYVYALAPKRKRNYLLINFAFLSVTNTEDIFLLIDDLVINEL